MGGLREYRLRPLIFLGNNPISLIGGALTTASAMILIGFWVVAVFAHGAPASPYVGIVVDLFLPGLFILGLLLIPIGILVRRRRLKAAGQLPSEYPKVDLGDPVFRRGLDFVLVATFINFVIVGTASYRSVAYMDTPNFCGQSCHVMKPEWTAYHVFPHSHVACTDCHIASVDGAATRSCQTTLASAAGKRVVTIEGLAANGLHLVQEAWIAEQVPQCGYCQPGQIMSAAALLAQNPRPTDTDIDEAMAGNLCRCATYFRIRSAIHRAAGETHS